jgi:hypothetical protein
MVGPGGTVPRGQYYQAGEFGINRFIPQGRIRFRREDSPESSSLFSTFQWGLRLFSGDFDGQAEVVSEGCGGAW